jgi:hypothetical protein
MRPQTKALCKVTITLPCALVEYADREAASRSLSRSEIIGRALANAKRAGMDALVARGYAFYAQESEAFAAASPR